MEPLLEHLKPTHPDAKPVPASEGCSTLGEVIDNIQPLDVPERTSPDEAGVMTLQKIEDIQAAVRASIRFDKKSTMESLAEEQETDCIGYSILGSEALEKAGIPHSVAFMNTHAFLLARVPSSQGTRLHFVDMLSPEFNQDLTDDISFYVDDSTTQQGDEVIKRTFGIVTNSKIKVPDNDLAKASEESPWLVIQGKGTVNHPESLYGHNLVITMFEPEQGRDVLNNYGLFRQSLLSGDTDLSATAINEMYGVFPDIDIRVKHSQDISALTKALCAKREYDTAQNVVQAFYSSFIGSDTRRFEREADCLRIIAKASGRKGLARTAVELYENAKKVKRTALASSLQGKMAVSRALEESLGSDDQDEDPGEAKGSDQQIVPAPSLSTP